MKEQNDKAWLKMAIHKLDFFQGSLGAMAAGLPELENKIALTNVRHSLRAAQTCLLSAVDELEVLSGDK